MMYMTCANSASLITSLTTSGS
jgi:sugar lactone lactonase YvrE